MLYDLFLNVSPNQMISFEISYIKENKGQWYYQKNISPHFLESRNPINLFFNNDLPI